jgi:hypothetical protein
MLLERLASSVLIASMLSTGIAANADAGLPIDFTADRRNLCIAGLDANPPASFAPFVDSLDVDGFTGEQSSQWVGADFSGIGRSETPGEFVTTGGDPEAYSDASFDFETSRRLVLRVEATLTVTDPDAWQTFQFDGRARVQVLRTDGGLDVIFEEEVSFPSTVVVDESLLLLPGDYRFTASAAVFNFEEASAEWQVRTTVSDPFTVPATGSPHFVAITILTAWLSLQLRRRTVGSLRSRSARPLAASSGRKG